MLTKQQKSARAAAEKRRQIKRWEARLDRHVIAAERLKSGKTKAWHEAEAEEAREELRKLDF